MNAEQKRKGLIFGISGVLLQIGCAVAMWIHPSLKMNDGLISFSWTYFLFEAGFWIGALLLIDAVRYYAKAKGYPSAYGFFGLLGIIEVLIIAALPDRTAS